MSWKPRVTFAACASATCSAAAARRRSPGPTPALTSPASTSAPSKSNWRSARPKPPESPAEFLAADVSSRPQELAPESFDVVYTGGGALGWLPDLDSWAASIHELLKPSGRLILNEEHPQLGNLEVRDGSIAIVGDYFDRQPHRTTGWRHFAGAEDALEPRWEFSWTLGDIVTSVARAGLRIESLQEFPSTASWRFGDDLPTVRRLLGSFLLIARKSDA